MHQAKSWYYVEKYDRQRKRAFDKLDRSRSNARALATKEQAITAATASGARRSAPNAPQSLPPGVGTVRQPQARISPLATVTDAEIARRVAAAPEVLPHAPEPADFQRMAAGREARTEMFKRALKIGRPL